MPTTPSWLLPFAPAVQQAFLPHLRPPTGERRVACFDADGTLWSEDIGEAFLRWLIAGRLVAADCSRDVYAEYEERVRRNLTEGFSWAVQLMAGLDEAKLVGWADQMAAAWPTYRPQMIGLLRGLAESGVEVWLVSATNQWVVQATARRMGTDPARAIGIRVAVDDDRLTDRLLHPIPSQAGKVEALRQAIGRLPDLACGDGLGDLAMLESARQPVVVGRRVTDEDESQLVRIARQRGWPVQLF